MKNYLKIAALTAIVGFGAASCSQVVVPDDNGGGTPNGNGKMDVTFTLGHYQDGVTLPNPSADGQTVTWNTTTLPSLIVLTDAKGQITYANGITPDGADNTLKYSDLFPDAGTSSKPIKDVSNKTANIYFWGNINNQQAPKTKKEDPTNGDIWSQIKAGGYKLLQKGQNVSAILALQANVRLQTNISPAEGSLSDDNSVLYGKGDVKALPNDPTKANATVEIAPLITRIEIKQIIGSTKSGEAVKSFDLLGIYVDNFQDNLKIDGTTVGKTLNTFSTGTNSKDNFDPSKSSTFKYGAESYNMLTDGQFTPATGGTDGTPYTYTPGDNLRWAYNMFGGYPYDAKDAEADKGIATPYIVLRVQNVVDGNDNKNPDVKFLVVRKWHKNGGDVIKSFQAGHVYKIENLTVSTTNIDPDPSTENEDVTVTVTPIQWKGEDIYQ